MKEFIKPAILVIISCLFVYILGAFVNATFNITLWSDNARVAAAILMFMVAIFVLGCYVVYKNEY